MRIFPFLLLVLFVPSVFAEEAEKIPVFETRPYDPENNRGRGVDEFFQGLGLNTIGTIYKAVALDVKSDVLTELQTPALMKYFTYDELEKMAAPVAATIEHEILSGVLTNEKANAAYRYGVNTLVAQVIHRIMEREGVTDPFRRNVWVGKILATYNLCMNKVRAYSEGKGCSKAFMEDVDKNIGLAMSYELARQELHPSYASQRALEYRTCLQPAKPGATDRVADCVLRAMQSGIIAYSKEKVIESGKDIGKIEAGRVASKVMPEYEACVRKASHKAAISHCIDDLTIRAGRELARATVLLNKGFSDAFREPKERNTVAASVGLEFERCMLGNLRSNRRDEGGRLDTKNCEDAVTNSATKRVILKTYLTNIHEQVGAKEPAAQRIYSKVTAKLNSCWDSASLDKSKVCLRESTQALVGEIASYRLDKELPKELVISRPALKDELLGGLGSCLRAKLPADLVESNEVDQKVSECTNALLREASITVATHEIASVVEGKLTEKETQALVEKLVHKELALCLGKEPDSKKVDSCAALLRRSAGKEIGAVLFPKEFDAFVQKGGGLAAYGIEASAREKFLKELLATHGSCLEKGISDKDPVKSDAALTSCFKASVKTLAGYLGQLEFFRGAKQYVAEPKELSSLGRRFDESFSACLEEKNGAAHDIQAYVAHVDTCGARLTKVFTRELGRRQVKSALGQHLADSPQESARIEKEVTRNFDSCMDKVAEGDTPALDRCTRALELEATEKIVIAAGTQQMKKELGVEKAPKPVQEAEIAFRKCLRSLPAAEPTDSCVKSYVQKMAKSIGSIKLNQALGGALGAKEFAASRDTLKLLEENFKKCVDGIQVPNAGDEFMAQIDRCTTKLQDEAIGFLQQRIDTWMKSEEDTEQARLVKGQIALALPCFDALAGSSPSTDAAEVDPEGMLQALAKIIGEYISYDAARAGGDLNAVLAQLARDLEAAGPEEARRKLVHLLAEKGVLDQLLKSVIRAEIRDSFQASPKEERLPAALEKKLLEPATFDEIFAGETMAKLRPMLAKSILEPLLIDGKSMNSPELTAAQNTLKKEIAETLLTHKTFGQLILDTMVQKGLDETGGLEGFFGRLIYGKRAFKWEHLRTTPHGQSAESYIREQLLRPKFHGQVLSEEEMRKRMDRANELVREAVTNS